MAHLGEKFADIARIEISGDNVSSLKHALMTLDAKGLRVTVEEATVGAPAKGPVFSLDLVGLDHPGIVRDITRCLAERGASVEVRETQIRGAPPGEGILFYAQARVRVPPSLSEEELRQDLESLAGELIVDITLREEVLNPDQ